MYFPSRCKNTPILHNIGLKPSQNRKSQKIFQLHCFFNTFLQPAAEKKYSKRGAAGSFFDSSYFVTALEKLISKFEIH